MSDEFGNYIEDRSERKSQSKFRRTEWVKLEDGSDVVLRILDNHEVRHYTHYLGWAYVKCLGDECPICQNNKKIMYEHPEDFRDVKGWNPRRDRYYINVMDRTLIKVCDKCQTENSTKAEVCSACGTVLGAAKPAGKVKVLTGSAKLFEDLKVLSKTVRDENDERVDIRTYDWVLITTGKGRDKTTRVRDRYNSANAGFIEVPADQLYDLEKVVVVLTPEEMLEVFNGAALKDIFAVRRASKQVVNADAELTDRLKSDMDDIVGDIFKAG